MHRILSAEELLHNRKSTDKSLPDSGGQKGYAPTKTWLEDTQLDCLLRERRDLLDEPRVAKLGDLLQGDWDSETGQVKISKVKGKTLQHMGRTVDQLKVLHPEEALFLMEMAALEVACKGVPLSLFEAYSLFLPEPNDLAKYKVYAHLSRLGYTVVRHQGRLNITPYERKINLDQYIQTKKAAQKNKEKINESSTSTKKPVSENTDLEAIEMDVTVAVATTSSTKPITENTSEVIYLEAVANDVTVTAPIKELPIVTKFIEDQSSSNSSVEIIECSLNVQSNSQAAVQGFEKPAILSSQGIQFQSTLETIPESNNSFEPLIVESFECRKSSSLCESTQNASMDFEETQLPKECEKTVDAINVSMKKELSSNLTSELNEFYKSLEEPEMSSLGDPTESLKWEIKPEIPTQRVNKPFHENVEELLLHEDVVFPNFAGKDSILLMKIPEKFLPKHVCPAKELYKMSKSAFLCPENVKPSYQDNRRNLFNHLRGAKFGNRRMTSHSNQSHRNFAQEREVVNPSSNRGIQNCGRLNSSEDRNVPKFRDVLNTSYIDLTNEMETDSNNDPQNAVSVQKPTDSVKTLETAVIPNSDFSENIQSEGGDVLGFIDRKKPSDSSNSPVESKSNHQKRNSSNPSADRHPNKFLKEDSTTLKSTPQQQYQRQEHKMPFPKNSDSRTFDKNQQPSLQSCQRNSTHNQAESRNRYSNNNNPNTRSRRNYPEEKISATHKERTPTGREFSPSFLSYKHYLDDRNFVRDRHPTDTWTPSSSRLDPPKYIINNTFDEIPANKHDFTRNRSAKPNALNPNAKPFEPKFSPETSGPRQQLNVNDNRYSQNIRETGNNYMEHISEAKDSNLKSSQQANLNQPSRPNLSRWDNGSASSIPLKRPRRDNWRGGPEYPSAVPKLPVSVSNWSRFKGALHTLTDRKGQGMGEESVLYTGQAHPLVKCHQRTDIVDVMSKLKIIPEVDLTVHDDHTRIPDLSGDQNKIHFDVYLPNTRFKPSNPTLPNLRLVVISHADPVPSLHLVAHLTRPLSNAVPLYFAVAGHDGVAFYGMHNVSLPQLNPAQASAS